MKQKIPVRFPLLDKTLMIISPIAIIALLISSFILISNYKTDQVQYTYDTLLETATNKSLYFTDQLEFNLNLVKALTTFPDVYSMDRERQRAFFADRASIMGYNQFFVVDNDGISYYFNSSVQKDQSKEPFFAAISQVDTYITEPYYTDAGPIITLCSAIYNENNERVGTLCATFDLDYIQDVIKDSQSSLSIYSFIVNSDGNYIAVDSFGNTTDKKSVFTNEGNSLSIVQDCFNDKENKTGTITVKGTEYYAAIIYMKSTSWCLIECTETSTIIKQVYRIQVIELLVVILLISMLLAIFHIIYSWNKNFKKLHKDTLCDCASRAACLETISDLEKGNACDVGILYMDLNNFKYVNDNFGHEKGDEILKIFADTCMTYLSPLGFFGRMGGDEFIGIFRNTETTKINEAIKSIEWDLASKSKHLSFEYTITAAFGFRMHMAGDEESLNDVVMAADSAMYIEKAKMKAEQNEQA